jgi:hypothetical protein
LEAVLRPRRDAQRDVQVRVRCKLLPLAEHARARHLRCNAPRCNVLQAVATRCVAPPCHGLTAQSKQRADVGRAVAVRKRG